MDARQTNRIESHQRVKVFLEANPAPDNAGIAQAKAALDAVLAELTDHSSAQVAGGQLSRFERRRVESLMKKLRDQHMKPIATIAKGEIDAQPGITEALRMPEGGTGPVTLLAAARAMLTSASKFQPTFVRHGRPEDFLDQFGAAIDAIEEALVGQSQNIGTKVGARAGLAKALQRGRRAVEILDPLVKIAFEGNAVVLAQWATAKRVRAVPMPSALESETPDISPTPEQPPTAA
ncbi:MAG: hypothetical protein ACREOK_12530 [Gemmatimonadaceae bacterium]